MKSTRVTIITLSLAIACCFLLSGCRDPHLDEPECSADTNYCAEEAPVCLVEENRCVECLVAEDCAEATMRCLDWTCFPEAAPDFTLVDLNPHSSSYEESVTLSDHFGNVILVYFASLG